MAAEVPAKPFAIPAGTSAIDVKHWRDGTVRVVCYHYDVSGWVELNGYTWAQPWEPDELSDVFAAADAIFERESRADHP